MSNKARQRLLGNDRPREAVFAMKVIDLSRFSPKDKALLRSEIKLLGMLDHPHIVKLHEVCETSSGGSVDRAVGDRMALIMELLSGGNLGTL